MKSQLPSISGMADLRVAAFPDQVVDMIEDLIAMGELRGGDRLTEQWLSDSLGVSRTPMREAIKILTARGLLKTRPNAGAVVNLPDEQEAKQLVQVMGWLWEKLAVMVVQNISAQQEAEIKGLQEEMCALVESGDMLGWAKLNRKFHNQIIRSSGNEVACEIAINLQMRLYLCFAIGQRTVDRQRQANEEHALIVGAIAARDAERIADMLTRHTGKAFATAYETGVISKSEKNQSTDESA